MTPVFVLDELQGRDFVDRIFTIDDVVTIETNKRSSILSSFLPRYFNTFFEIFGQNPFHEQLIRKFLHPVTIAKQISHTWEKRFIQSEISGQIESVSSRLVHVIVGASSIFIHRIMYFSVLAN